MTCIIAYKFDDVVYIGGDSIAADMDTYSKDIIINPKVFKNGKFLIGYTTSFRIGQLLEYTLIPPKKNKKQDVMQYLCNNFIDEIRRLFVDNGYDMLKSNSGGGTFLFAYKGDIYLVQNDYSILIVDTAYNAVGSGYKAALAAMNVLEEIDPKCKRYSPEEKLQIAFRAVEKHNNSVAGPFIVMKDK